MPEPSVGLNEAWIWLAGSFVLAVVSANVAWFFHKPRSGPIGSAVAQLVARPDSGTLYQFLRLVYYIGVPFAALLLGHDAVTTRFLGLQPLQVPSAAGVSSGDIIAQNWMNWARDAGWAAAAGASVFLFLLASWWAYRRALAAADFQEKRVPAPISGWTHLREAAFHEVHWSFYRNAPLLALRSYAQGAYWGIWLGLGIVALEAALNPEWRRGLAIPEQAPARLMRAALAVLSVIVFWKTQNLWLAILLHLVISWGLSSIARAATPGSD